LPPSSPVYRYSVTRYRYPKNQSTRTRECPIHNWLQATSPCSSGERFDSYSLRFASLRFFWLRQRQRQLQRQQLQWRRRRWRARFRYRNLTKHSFRFAWRLTAETAREAETVAATASHYYAFAALVGRNGWGASCGESERMREQTRGRRECERQTSACQRVREREREGKTINNNSFKRRQAP